MYLPTLRAQFSLNSPLLMRQRRFKRCRPPAPISRSGVRLRRTFRRSVSHLCARIEKLQHVNPPPPRSSEDFDHRSIVLVDPMDARSSLGPRARVAGETISKAKTAYDDFLMLLKNADQDTGGRGARAIRPLP
jgi:hypothetical protein